MGPTGISCTTTDRTPSALRRATQFPTRFALSVSSFHDDLLSGRLDLLGFLDRAAMLGFRSVEICDRSIPSPEPDAIARVTRACAERRLSVACLDIRNDFTTLDPDAWERQVAHVERWIKVAPALGTRLARVWGGRSATDHDAFRRVCRGFRKVVPTAQACGVRLALENHGGILSEADTIIQVIDFVGSPWLGACPDPGWFAAPDRIRSLRKVFPYAIHVHAKTHRFTDAGLEAEIDYREIAAIARDTRYQGFFSVEFEGEGADRETGVLQTVALLHRFFGGRTTRRAATKHAHATPGRRAATAPASWAQPPYVTRLRTPNCWDEARSAILPFAERLAQDSQTAGVVILGGVANTPHRRFIDRYSDLDLTVFVSVPEARDYLCPKQFWREHPERIPAWLSEFQFETPLPSGPLIEVNCHQLIIEIEENPLLEWDQAKQEAYAETGEIHYDPLGRITRLIRHKCRPQLRTDRLIVLASQLPWYGWINPERMLARGFPDHVQLLVNRAAEMVTEMLFLANGRLAPHLKWRYEMTLDLPWLPVDFRRRFGRLLGPGSPPERIAASRSLCEEVLRHLHDEAFIPADAFRYVTQHLDRDRQLCPHPTQEWFDPLCRNDSAGRVIGRVTRTPPVSSDASTETLWSSSSTPGHPRAISRA